MNTPSLATERRHPRLVVERGFQFKFTLRICLIASGVFLCFGGALLFIIKMNYEMLIQNALLEMPEMVSKLQREFRFLSLAIVTAFILMTGVMFGLGLVLTQRLAGPLFAFRRQLREFAEGKRPVRLALRTGDEFASLAQTFNHAMESWEHRASTRDESIRHALEAIAHGDKDRATQALQKALQH